MQVRAAFFVLDFKFLVPKGTILKEIFDNIFQVTEISLAEMGGFKVAPVGTIFNLNPSFLSLLEDTTGAN